MVRQELIHDIRRHPERHRHAFDALLECCMRDGAVDLSAMEAHEGVFPDRPRCDVASGKCSCGGSH